MSHYQAYCDRTPRLKHAEEQILLALGFSKDGTINSHNDKHCMEFAVKELGYGYYGSSSYYRIDNEDAKSALVRACNEMRHKIADKAIKYLREESEALRRAAETEARSVFDNVTTAEGKS